ncbi:petJ [Symbiodinium sp. CCMP2592]|nr:petJ [Symbiodinium sp. CCMP2592]
MAFRTLRLLLLLLLPCAASLPVPLPFGAAKSPAAPRPKPWAARPPQAQARREDRPGWQLFLCSACVGLALAPAVRAADLVNGEAVFDANCVSCHAGGGNKIYPLQTLSRSALERNGKYSVELIAQQVSNGQTPMPAFSDKLTEKSIEDVASFVYAEAEVNWKDKKLVGGSARRFSQFLDSLWPFQ